ncbi:hypothetical protein [Ekhidna sp.]|uniref:hypothetical protein n=1 Tax=Ekhidna sp. TaxID=2608089 RepID=UPI003CCB7894
MRKSLLILFVISITCVSYAQDTRSAEVRKPPRPQYQATKKEKKGFFDFFKKDKKAELKTSQEELIAFRKRVSKAYAENAKVERKVVKHKKREAKKGEKFHGHKRPPKKRPPGKQKFCKVCRIKH